MDAMERREHFGKIWSCHDASNPTELGDRMKRLGVDVGGTFTDLIYVDDEAGKISSTSCPTTPDDPSRGTVRGHRAS